MISLLGSLLGFGTSFLPQILDFFKQAQAHKQKMESMRLQAELMEKRSALRIQELDKQADISETEGLYAHDRSIQSGGFIDALRGSVRPVITYAFFLMFVATEVVIVVRVMQMGGDWTQAVELMWTPETSGLFAAVMSFWFGNRAVSKFINKK